MFWYYCLQKNNNYINQLIELSQCWIDMFSGRMIVAAGDLVNTYDGDDLGTMLDDIEKSLCVLPIIQFHH